MHEINLAAVDLNLLVALDALLRERSVTRAARRVGLGQPAMSHALGRLRELLGDPILVRTGRGMVATPRAEALKQPVEEAFRALRAVLRSEPPFDPRHSTRRFALACPDLIAPVLPALLATLREAAPGVDLVVIRPEGGMLAAVERQGADVVLGTEQEPGGGIHCSLLGHATWATLCRPDHPFVRQPDLGTWLARGHVQISTGGGGESVVDQLLRQKGHSRRIALSLPSFLLAPPVVAQSDLLYTGPAAFLRSPAEELGLVLCTPPLALPAAPVVMGWPARLDAEAGLCWFRERVSEGVRAVLERSGSTV